MLKIYETIYDNGQLNWLGTKPNLTKARVIVVVEEDAIENHGKRSIKWLKGIAPKPEWPVSLEEMDNAVQLEGAKL